MSLQLYPVVGVLELEVQPVPNIATVRNFFFRNIADSGPTIRSYGVSPHLEIVSMLNGKWAAAGVLWPTSYFYTSSFKTLAIYFIVFELLLC